uniref:Uncharacterized protein n=1 Tax=Oryza glumipatula TaxID=40148 RepID=A0A0E0AZ20_9ORYZ
MEEPEICADDGDDEEDGQVWRLRLDHCACAQGVRSSKEASAASLISAIYRRRRPQVIIIFIGVHEEKRSLDGCLPPFIGNPRDETREGCGQSNSRARSLDGRQGIKV